MSTELKEKHFDVRLVSRFQKRGVVKDGDLQKHMSDLPNDEDNFDLVPFEDEEVFIDETFTADYSEEQESTEL